MNEALGHLQETLWGADEAGAVEETRRLLAEGVDPRVILESGLAAAMAELGRRWNRGEVFLPEVVAAAEVFRRCSELVEPVLLARGEKQASHRVVIGTVRGDLHDLGKNIVGAMMKTAGFEVHDLGKDVPAGKFVAAVRDLGASLLGLSALLTTTMMEQKAVIEALEKEGLRSSVKVMVGGAPVTGQWAAAIGADGYAPNAPEAVELALQLVDGQQ
ncbi:MAG TPA: hypothetical protein GX513_13205 [Firmicutes bacterium]|nr:hypothetical protein [Bacillota bacterium]